MALLMMSIDINKHFFFFYFENLTLKIPAFENSGPWKFRQWKIPTLKIPTLENSDPENFDPGKFRPWKISTLENSDPGKWWPWKMTTLENDDSWKNYDLWKMFITDAKWMLNSLELRNVGLNLKSLNLYVLEDLSGEWKPCCSHQNSHNYSRWWGTQ